MNCIAKFYLPILFISIFVSCQKQNILETNNSKKALNDLQHKCCSLPLLDNSIIYHDRRKPGWSDSVKTLRNSKKEIKKGVLKKFLKYKLARIEIRGSSSGCWHRYYSCLCFERAKDNFYQCSKLYESNLFEVTSKAIKKLSFSASEIEKVLNEINLEPLRKPSIHEFNISKNDLKAFRTKDINRRNIGPRYLSALSKRFNRDRLIKRLFTISDNKLSKVLKGVTLRHGISIYSTDFYVVLHNNNNDTLRISKTKNGAWLLPWEIKINNVRFQVYSLKLSKFLKKVLPDAFVNKHFLDEGNLYLLYQMGIYLDRKN